MPGTLARTRGALRSRDFRRLFAARVVSSFGDGLLQAALVTTIVFSPQRQSTTVGFAIASLVVILPYTVVGPFAGVFIDRWPRRRILAVAPALRATLAWLVLFDPTRTAVPFYAGALLVLSINRFYLSTASAVVPRLVPTEDLLVANSLATIGGTTALLAGVFVGGLASDALGIVPAVAGAAIAWIAAAAVATTIRSSLVPHRLDASREPLEEELRRVVRDFADGVRHLTRTPRALGPVVSISLDQMGQGLVLVLSLFVFRERFREGVGSFSYLIGAGGLGVLVGLLTVGSLEERFAKERIVAGGFVVGGITLIAVAVDITGWSVLLASFVVGLAFAWKKIPVDTMVQEAVPDGYRGRIFAVYDVAYQGLRLLAAFLAIPMLPALGPGWSVALVGAGFLAWAPVLPRWLRRAPEIELRFYAGAKADEWPRTVVWGGVEQPAEVQRSWWEELHGVRRLCFRLLLADGTVIEVSRPESDETWHLERELDRQPG
jgi:MFS family permease